MRWFSRRPDPAPRGRHAAGATAVAAAPVTRAEVPEERRVVTAPLAGSNSPIVPPGSGVHLGFGDGSVLELAVGDRRAAAFRALAASLAQGVR